MSYPQTTWVDSRGSCNPGQTSTKPTLPPITYPPQNGQGFSTPVYGAPVAYPVQYPDVEKGHGQPTTMAGHPKIGPSSTTKGTNASNAAKTASTGGDAATKRRQRCCIWLVILAIVVAAAVAAGVIISKRKQTGSNNQDETVYVTLQSNQMKAGAMGAAVQLFNSGKGVNNTLPTGERVNVVLTTPSTSSLDRSRQPVMFSPVTSFWVDSENVISSSAQCVDLTSIPVGLAMWRKMATALGWPNKPISLSQIIDIAQHPDGWGVLGDSYKPWGQLKIGHGHLNSSNSGRYFTLAAIYSVLANSSSPRLASITNRTVWDPAVRKAINSLENHTYHLGRSDNALLQHMLDRGQGYLQAVPTYESTVIDFNRLHGDELQSKYGDDIVFIYPSDGTFWAKNPLCILDTAPWVPRWSYNGGGSIRGDSLQMQGAKLFQEFITAPERKQLFLEYGVRPSLTDSTTFVRPLDWSDTDIKPGMGALPNVTVESVALLPEPSADVITELLKMWYQEKKAVVVAVVLDTSGSMGESGSMEAAKQNMADFIRQLGDNDYLLPISFSSNFTVLHPLGRVGDIRNASIAAVNALYSDGSTALYKTVAYALDQLDAIRAAQAASGSPIMNFALVVMTDGEDTAGGKDVVMAKLPSGEDPSEVHIYSIAYGAGGNDLGRTTSFFIDISGKTNGLTFGADRQSMNSVWNEISIQF